METTRKHTISVLVENRPGVLARVAGLFARRGYNINSLAVSTTEEADISRMTVVTSGTEHELEQIIKQLNKLVDVIKTLDHTDDILIEREIALIKLAAGKENRTEVMRLAQTYGADIVSLSSRESTLIVQITGDENRVDAFLEALEEVEVLEMVRTGKIALVRGSKET